MRVGWGYGGWYGGFAYRSYGGRAGWWGPGGCRYIDEINTSRTITTPRGTFQSYGRIERDGNELNFERSSSWTPNENIYERRDNAQRNIEDRREERRAEREERRGEAGDRGGDRADRRGEPGDRGGDRADRARTADATGRRNDLFADREAHLRGPVLPHGHRPPGPAGGGRLHREDDRAVEGLHGRHDHEVAARGRDRCRSCEPEAGH